MLHPSSYFFVGKKCALYRKLLKNKPGHDLQSKMSEVVTFYR